MRLRFLAALSIAGLAACGDGTGPDGKTRCPAPALVAAPSPFDDEFERAAAQYRVPASLLAAIGYVETRWQMVEGHEEMGQAAAYGVMALRGERLERAAQLAGLPAERVRTDASANISAAAALLRAYADQQQLEPAAVEQWAPLVRRFSGIDLPAGAQEYTDLVMRRVAGLRSLAFAADPDDCGKPVTPPVTPPAIPRGPDFSGSIWRPSPNFNSRMAGQGGVPQVLIIHTCEGNYSGCWSWLTNTVSQVSAHYVVNEDGSEISQLVREESRAWHIGATYDCALNRSRLCNLTGVQSNHFTIGIEHGGFASQTTFPDGQIDASARLACDITRDHAIPRDWQHIVAHGQLQPYNRTDPGRNWPWVKYVTLIQRHCGETVVDDNLNYNDRDYALAPVTTDWFASDSTAGYYGIGYRWAATSESATDAFVFRFRMNEAGSRTIDARWTAGANRAGAATFEIVDANGSRLATVTVDQRTGNNTWRTLGTWTFPVGWHEVRLLRRGPAGSVVVADAVRIRQP